MRAALVQTVKTLVAVMRGPCLNPPRMSTPQGRPPLWDDAGIFFVSALILQLELVLIRWIGTEIRIFRISGRSNPRRLVVSSATASRRAVDLFP